MTRARVLLLDDDPTIRFYVGLALADLPVDLLECAGVDDAVAALRSTPCRLLLTDLVLRGGSGFDLLQLLQHEPALLGGGRVAVYSAALTPEVQQRLANFDVWRTLAKPATIAELRACVEDALAAEPAAVRKALTEAAAPSTLDADQARAVEQHFAGDLRLYEGFRASCEQQFDDDRRRIDEAFARDDADGVHRVCHSLKTVLLMLGQPTLAAQARALDAAARAGDRPVMNTLWPDFRRALAPGAQPAADRPSATGASEGGGAR